MFARRRLLLSLPLLLAFFFVEVRPSPAAQGLAGEWAQFPQLASGSFISHVITAIGRDASDRLWIGTDRGLVWTADDGETWNQANLAAALPQNQPPDLATQPAALALEGESLILRNSVTSISVGDNGIWVGTRNSLCFGSAGLKSWICFPTDAEAPGSEIQAVTEYMGEVWVSSESGLFKSNDGGAQWEKIQGPFPPGISSITVADTPYGRSVWLAGFDAPVRRGGGPDIFRSDDGGASWRALKTGTASAISQAVSSKAHRIALIDGALWACTRHGLARSGDWGKSWTRIKGKDGVKTDEIFDIILWDGKLWITTREGLYFSSDNGKTWEHDVRLYCPVRFGTAGTSRLWLATDGGLIARASSGKWQSYSDCSDALCMAVTQAREEEVWWVGTAGGLAVSKDAGQNWRILTVADGLPSNLILCLASDGRRVWAGTDGGVWLAARGGDWGKRFGKEHGLGGLLAHDIIASPNGIWTATDQGLCWLPRREIEWRVMQGGKEWRAICYAQGIMYGLVADNAAPRPQMRLICGKPEINEWRTLRVQGRENLHVNQLLDVGDDIWLACEEGLFRTRDGGATWAKFAEETLWGPRVTRMCRGPEDLLCVHSVPAESPALKGGINVTRDGGRSWSVFAAPLPGQLQTMAVNNDRLMVGTTGAPFGDSPMRGMVAAYDGFERDLRPVRKDMESSLRGPEGVLVVVNEQSAESVTVGEEYAEARNIPEGNICRINCSDAETITRETFNNELREPILDYLLAKGLNRKISFIVTTRGVPLRIAYGADENRHGRGGVRTEASVDSELALIGREYSIEGAIPNPYFQRDQPFDANLFGIYLVTRLDGPDMDSIARLYKDAIAVEGERAFGSNGFARFDLYPINNQVNDSTNAGILHNYELMVRQENLADRVIYPEHSRAPLFRAGSGRDTFFYIGWGADSYRPRVFSWIPGAIAVELDPAGAATLHQAAGSWAAGAVEAGVIATMGTVYDPAPIDTLAVDNLYRYTAAGYTWAEIAYMSIENLSWQAVVVGDPLYTPMK